MPQDGVRRNEMIREILGGADEDTFVNQPFHCDYGKHIFVGKRFFSNFNFTVLDEARVSIGDDCFIGPNVSIYTACHSTDPVERNTRREWAEPVTIGDNCWIGGSSTILPGVTIGDNVTIGANACIIGDGLQIGDNVTIAAAAFVNKDIPAGHLFVTRFTSEQILLQQGPSPISTRNTRQTK